MSLRPYFSLLSQFLDLIALMTSSVDSPRLMMPGDVAMKVPDGGSLKLGPGLIVSENEVKSLRAGTIHEIKNKSGTSHLFLTGRSKRYLPQVDDAIIGIVLDRQMENFVIDIRGPFPALLPQLSFEGATKRNRPNLKPGDLVYARVVEASRDLEPILTCVDALGRAGGLGQLSEGSLVQVSTAMARRLLQGGQASPVLEALGEAGLQFDMAVGANGRIWVLAAGGTAESISTTILISNALESSEKLTDQQQRVLVSHLLNQNRISR